MFYNYNIMLTDKILNIMNINHNSQTDFLLDIAQLKVKKFKLVDIKKIKLNFINQFGGDIKNIIIDNNEYFYNIETGITVNAKKQEYTLKLITLDGYEGCGTILYSLLSKKANISNVYSANECIFTKDPNIKYKVGDILMQIMIYICRQLKIKYLELTDNSNYPFTGEGIKLSIFRTMTKGEPYYMKFGFLNIIEKNKINENKSVYKKKPKMNADEILKIIKNNIDTEDQYYNDAINILNKVTKKVKNNIIDVTAFVNYIFAKAKDEEKNIEIVRDKNAKNVRNRIALINKYSYILNRIMIDLYTKSGYKLLTNEKYILELT